jgi:hypothetical protein
MPDTIPFQQIRDDIQRLLFLASPRQQAPIKNYEPGDDATKAFQAIEAATLGKDPPGGEPREWFHQLRLSAWQLREFIRSGGHGEKVPELVRCLIHYQDKLRDYQAEVEHGAETTAGEPLLARNGLLPESEISRLFSGKQGQLLRLLNRNKAISKDGLLAEIYGGAQKLEALEQLVTRTSKKLADHKLEIKRKGQMFFLSPLS